MLVKDRNIKKKVDVSDPDCPKRSCYWPRPDPGIFTQGHGYAQRSANVGWLCGNREIMGCPINKPLPQQIRKTMAYDSCWYCQKENGACGADVIGVGCPDERAKVKGVNSGNTRLCYEFHKSDMSRITRTLYVFFY